MVPAVFAQSRRSGNRTKDTLIQDGARQPRGKANTMTRRRRSQSMSSSKQKIRSLLMFCTAVVVGVALITAPMTATAAKTDDKTQMEDSWVTAKTKIALFADPRVKGREINVETKDSLVMLRGKVDNDEAKKAAEEIAKLVDGVKSVKNELQVVAPSMRDRKSTRLNS